MKDIKFPNYKGDIDAIITAEPDRYGNECQQLAWYIDGFYAGTEGAHDIWLAGTPMGEYRNDAMLLEYAIPESGTTVELSLKAGSSWFDPDQEVTVDWGDGSGLTIVSATSGQSGYIGHEYASEGNYIVRVAGSLKMYGRTANENIAGQELLTHIRSFGQLGIVSFFRAFSGGTGLISVPKYLPSSVTTMASMFNGCSGSAFNPDVSPWDVSSVTNMCYMFNVCSGASFNPDVSTWNTSNVRDMRSMFSGCSGAAFNPDVSVWDVSNVRDMYAMFYNCPGAAFNPDVSNWDVSSVTDMASMFRNCSGATFNPDVSGWDVSSVTNMRYMFNVCSGAAFRGGRGEGEEGIEKWTPNSLSSVTTSGLDEFMSNSKKQEDGFLDSILIAWAALIDDAENPLPENITFHFGTNTYTEAAQDALEALQNHGTTGWIITSGGLAS